MHKEIEIRRIAPGSLFQILIIGFSLTIIPISLAFGILSAFGFGTVIVNRAHSSGIAGLFASLFFGPLLTLICSFGCWLMVSIGLWIHSRFRVLVIHYVPKEED